MPVPKPDAAAAGPMRAPRRWPMRLALAGLCAFSYLPLGVQAACGGALGAVLHALARSRRRIAARNVALCFPDWPEARRAALVREHFGWLARSLLERGLLWHADVARLRRLIQVDGDVGFAERSTRPVMWLVPHFTGLDVAGVAVQIFQTRPVASIYQSQSDPVMDAALRAGRTRFGNDRLFSRDASFRPLARALRDGMVFFNLPDMDFGLRDAAFVPFFGVPAATLLAPARIARALDVVVQPVVAQMLPGGAGYRVRFLPPLADFPGTDDDVAATARLNAWIESTILQMPAQYLWVHRRFKTTPPGEADRYGDDRGR